MSEMYQDIFRAGRINEQWPSSFHCTRSHVRSPLPKCQWLVDKRELFKRRPVEEMQMRSIVWLHTVFPLFVRLSVACPFWSLPRVSFPLLCFPCPPAMISTLTPITDSARLRRSIGAPLFPGPRFHGNKKITQDPHHCCSLRQLMALATRTHLRLVFGNRLQDEIWSCSANRNITEMMMKDSYPRLLVQINAQRQEGS